MDWKDLRRSTNVEDRRGAGLGGGVAIGGGGLILALLASFLFGGNPLDYLGLGGNSGAPSGQYQQTPENDQQAEFAERVLGDTEDVWSGIFQKLGRSYTPTTLVLYDGQTNAGCGLASAATGPFYCPEDRKVYLDLSFFRTLSSQLGAPGDFARAYVIAHEVGHHVQDELGILGKVDQQRQQADQRTANALSVKLELQADCLAGVWGHSTAQRDLISNADVQTAINAAASIGDDRLQQESQGYVVPDSFTHGTSAQRVAWFERGLKSGDLNDCNTFTQ